MNFKTWEEESSDDANYELHGRAFVVQPFDINSVDVNTVPLTSQEYLQQVIAQRAKLPGIVTASVPKFNNDQPRKLHNCFFPIEKIEESKHSPSLDWQQKQVSKFSDLRYSIECNKETYQKRATTLPKSKKDWFKYMFGENLNKECTEKLPYLSLVFSMNNDTIETLIKYITDWVNEDKLTVYIAGIWLFALIAFVEVPLRTKILKQLRIFVLKCRKLRQKTDFSIDENKKELAAQNLFICLVGRYFGQRDLSD